MIVMVKMSYLLMKMKMYFMYFKFTREIFYITSGRKFVLKKYLYVQYLTSNNLEVFA